MGITFAFAAFVKIFTSLQASGVNKRHLWWWLANKNLHVMPNFHKQSDIMFGRFFRASLIINVAVNR